MRGATSTEQHPSHVYSQSGVYSVTLTVSNGQGSDFATRQGYVVVDAPLAPWADLDASPTTGPAPLLVALASVSSFLMPKNIAYSVGTMTRVSMVAKNRPPIIVTAMFSKNTSGNSGIRPRIVVATVT